MKRPAWKSAVSCLWLGCKMKFNMYIGMYFYVSFWFPNFIPIYPMLSMQWHLVPYGTFRIERINDHGRHFIVLGHQYDRREVTRKRSVRVRTIKHSGRLATFPLPRATRISHKLADNIHLPINLLVSSLMVYSFHMTTFFQSSV